MHVHVHVHFVHVSMVKELWYKPWKSSPVSFVPKGGNEGNRLLGDTLFGLLGCFQNDCGKARNLIGTDSERINPYKMYYFSLSLKLYNRN